MQGMSLGQNPTSKLCYLGVRIAAAMHLSFTFPFPPSHHLAILNNTLAMSPLLKAYYLPMYLLVLFLPGPKVPRTAFLIISI